MAIDHFKINGFFDIHESVLVDAMIEGTGISPLSTADIDTKLKVDVGQGKSLKLLLNATAKISQTKDSVLETIDCNFKYRAFDRNGEEGELVNASFLSKVTEEANSYHFVAQERGAPAPLCMADIKFDKKRQTLSIDGNQKSSIISRETPANDGRVHAFETESKINGEFDFQTWSGTLKGVGSNKFSSSLLSEVFPSLDSNLSLSTEVILQMRNGTLEVNSLWIGCFNDENSFKISCQLANPVVIWDRVAGYVAWKNILNSGKSLLRVSIDDFNPKFLFTAKSPTRVDSHVSWQFNVSSKNGTFLINPHGEYPLLMKKCTAIRNSKKYWDNVDISCLPTVIFGENIEISLDDMAVGLSDGSEVLSGSLEISLSRTSKKSSMSCYVVCQLNKLCGLQFLSQSTAIRSGVCSCQATFTRGDNSIGGSGNLKIHEFTMKDGERPISGESNISFSREPENFQTNIDLNIPGEQSTIASIGIITSEDIGTGKINAKVELKGDSLCVPELIGISKIPLGVFRLKGIGLLPQIMAMFGTDDDDVRFGEPRKQSAAAWSVVNGSGIVDVKKVFLSKSLAIDNLECLCTVTDEKIDLKTVNFGIEGSQFNVSSKMEHVSGEVKNPYVFSLYSSFDMRDIGKLCRALDPSDVAAIDGIGRMSAQLTSKGSDVLETLRSSRGHLDVNCSNGTLCLARLLSKKSRAVVEAVELAKVFLAQKSDKFTQMSTLIEKLNRIAYYKVEISVKRSNSLDIIIDKFSAIGPEISVNGSGKISHLKYKHFSNYPLSLDIQINAAGELSESLEALGLIVDKPRNSPYMEGPRFMIKGTIGRPDYSDFTRILYQLF
jgi:hypothetical protein